MGRLAILGRSLNYNLRRHAKEMSDTEINKRIFEYCGWDYSEENQEWYQNGCKLNPKKDIPNYCEDLNEIHAAEKYMLGSDSPNIGEFLDYRWKLLSVVGSQGCPIHATAKQRANAFIITTAVTLKK
jgi:hypothetical protein